MKRFSNLKKLRNIFLSGLFVSLPIAVTLWILVTIFNTLDSFLGKPLTNLLGFRIPGLGLILVVLFILTAGIIANNVAGRRFIKYIESKILQFPIIKTIYMPIKDVLNNFSNKKSNNFKKAVFVEFPKENTLSIGFITKENVLVNGEEKTIIFVPTTPNPTSGFLIYLSKASYLELDIPVDVALKSIISLGSVSPDMLKTKRAN